MGSLEPQTRIFQAAERADRNPGSRQHVSWSGRTIVIIHDGSTRRDPYRLLWNSTVWQLSHVGVMKVGGRVLRKEL